MSAHPASGRTVHLSASGEDARILPDELGGFVLEIGGAVQSHVDPAEPTAIRYEYLRRVANVLDGVAPAGAPVRVLHLGAGALTLPRYVQATRPGSAQTAVDLDRELVSFVLAELPMPAGTDLDSVVADARLAAVDLLMDGERFDAVVLDIGTGEDGAEHLRGAAFYGELLGLLTDTGALLVNIGDDDGLRFLAAELGALEAACAEAGVPGPWTLASADMLERLELGNAVLAAGPALRAGAASGGTPSDADGDAGPLTPAALLARGPHPGAVLDEAESAALARRIGGR